MKTRMRISPFHVSMTILKTQIEKRENSKERCSHYLTKRTVCVILCVLAGSMCGYSARKERKDTMQPPSQMCTKHIDVNE